MSEKKKIHGVGIDVSKRKLDICLAGEGGGCHYFQVSNTEAGITKLITKLKRYQGKLVMESTGRYHLLVALLLSDAGLDLRVINPLLAKKYTTSNIRKNKTDKADARVLAQMAILEPDLPARFANDQEATGIRQKIGLISSLERQLQSLKAMLKDYTEFQGQLGLVESTAEQKIRETIKDLSKAKKELEEEIKAAAMNSKHDKQQEEILTSIPGVSSFLATLISQMLDINACQSSKQWIAYTGMDVTVRQSGQWNGRGKLSKRGNAYFRKRLFSGAWGAVMNHQDFRKLYDNLRAQGKRYVEAILIIARKILRIAFTLLKKNTLFDEKLCFQI